MAGRRHCPDGVMDVDDVRLAVTPCGSQSKIAAGLKGQQAEDRFSGGRLLGRSSVPQACREDRGDNEQAMPRFSVAAHF
jgi:hypothetical protein